MVLYKGERMSEEKKSEKADIAKIAEDVHTIKNITVTYFILGIIAFLIAVLAAFGSTR